MAWYVMHCPSLMMAVYSSEGFILFVQRLERSSWLQYYIFFIRKTILNGNDYQLDRCFPEIHDASYRDRFADSETPDGFTRLSSGVFWWLINIRPGYLVFRQGNSCTLEPYMSYWFARQFGYDQLYIGNPNPRLHFSGNLFEGARAWYYSVARGTGAIFTLPHKNPNFYASFDFCSWYFMANQVPGFGINTSYIRGIKSTYKTKLGSKGCRMRGMDEFQAAEKEEGVNPGGRSAGQGQPLQSRSLG